MVLVELMYVLSLLDCLIGNPKASPEEVAASLKTNQKVPPGKASAKAKAKPKTNPAKKDRSPQKPDVPSPNPVPSKRVKGKQAPTEDDGNQSNMIAELLEVGVWDFPSYIQILFLTSYICKTDVFLHLFPGSRPTKG